MKIPDRTGRIDLDDMRRRLGYDEALIADLLQLFLDVGPTQLKAVEAAVASRDAVSVQRSAHMLKSGATNLSASPLVDAAGRLERAAERGELGELDALAAALALEMEQLIEELRDMGAAS